MSGIEPLYTPKSISFYLAWIFLACSLVLLATLVMCVFFDMHMAVRCAIPQ